MEATVEGGKGQGRKEESVRAEAGTGEEESTWGEGIQPHVLLHPHTHHHSRGTPRLPPVYTSLSPPHPSTLPFTPPYTALLQTPPTCITLAFLYIQHSLLVLPNKLTFTKWSPEFLLITIPHEIDFYIRLRRMVYPGSWEGINKHYIQPKKTYKGSG